jgi:peptidyl-prolyl cis-trans isomerase A (cyclophilin A)
MRLTAIALVLLALVFIAAAPAPAQAQANIEKLMKPAQLNEQAPDKYQVKFDTSKGEFILEITREWAPLGADRFYNLVKNGYYDNCKFFRNIEGFMVQFGMHGNPKVGNAWRAVPIKDDPVKKSNLRGYITFAKTSAPNSRTTQVFINFGDNTNLDKTLRAFRQGYQGHERCRIALQQIRRQAGKRPAADRHGRQCLPRKDVPESGFRQSGDHCPGRGKIAAFRNCHKASVPPGFMPGGADASPGPFNKNSRHRPIRGIL